MNGTVIGRILLIVSLVIAIILMALYRDLLDVELLRQWIGNTGLLGALIFTLLFAFATVLLVPGLLFTLTGGILFGPFVGTLLNLIGATLGAGVAFLIARYIAADWVAEKSRGQIKRLIEGVDAEGWRFVVFIRLVPILPFFIVNYVLGITRISFTTYLISTFVALIPSVGAITYLGYVGRKAMVYGETMVQEFLIAMGLIAAFIFLPYFIKRWHGRPYQ